MGTPTLHGSFEAGGRATGRRVSPAQRGQPCGSPGWLQWCRDVEQGTAEDRQVGKASSSKAQCVCAGRGDLGARGSYGRDGRDKQHLLIIVTMLGFSCNSHVRESGNTQKS